MTNRLRTPPSRLPSDLYLSRASRTGPSIVTNAGSTLRAPNAVAISTCGLTAGLVPPAAGCEWHPTQLSRLKRGPSPLPMPSASENASSPLAKNACCVAVRPASIAPAPAAPRRTPGSREMSCPGAERARMTRLTTNVDSTAMRVLMRVSSSALDHRGRTGRRWQRWCQTVFARGFGALRAPPSAFDVSDRARVTRARHIGDGDGGNRERIRDWKASRDVQRGVNARRSSASKSLRSR